MSQSKEISQTIPRRRNEREVGRVGVLAVVGGASDFESFKQGRLVLIGGGLAIGRRPPSLPGSTSLAIADKTVSSYHLRIRHLMMGGYTIEDQGSTNGTFVDGHPLTGPMELQEGALIFAGAQIFVFRTMTEVELDAVAADQQQPMAPVPTLNPTLAVVCAKLRRLAPSSTELFLLGETGVGKEVFAHAIHRLSGRPGPLVAINCAALPRELVESELFGYERGAHSTAKTRKQGLIASADGGTLFLDELAEMPIDVQSKLLRFLQDRTYTPIGGTRLETADVRIVAASSRVAETGGAPLIQEALLGRLGAQPIALPPLRNRKEDLARLVAHFLAPVLDGRRFESEAFQALFLHEWPHNVRELQKVVNEAELLSRGMPVIGFDHLPPFISDVVDGSVLPKRSDPSASERLEVSPTPGSGPIPGRPRVEPGSITFGGEARTRSVDPARPPMLRRRRPVPSVDELRRLLRETEGNVAEVARRLDRQYAVVWRTMKRYGILPREWAGPPPAAAAAEDTSESDADDGDDDAPEDGGTTG
ncbi:MAG TPA: sigma 54-interacting transcriptional regulator [Polyangia bacterium]|nr:sigma 54-interacting transcriptional regulator [Polyangia bacterium]